MGPVIFIKLTFLMMVIGSLASGILKKQSRNLIDAINGLGWVLGFSQLQSHSYLEPRLAGDELLRQFTKDQMYRPTKDIKPTKVMDRLAHLFRAKLKVFDSFEEHVYYATNKLFHSIMKSKSKVNKRRALRALDPFLNDVTSAQLAKNRSSLIIKDLSATIDSLSVRGIKVIKKDYCNAKRLLMSKRDSYIYAEYLNDAKKSIWFLLNQLVLSPSTFKRTSGIPIDFFIATTIVNSVELRADTDLEYMRHAISVQLWTMAYMKRFPLYVYYFNKLADHEPLLYKGKGTWEVIGMLLLTEDPKFTMQILCEHNTARSFEWMNGRFSYLLFSRENPGRLLEKHPPLTVKEMYSRFVLASRFGLEKKSLLLLSGISFEKLAEVAERVAKIRSDPSIQYTSRLVDQISLPYLSLFSLARNQVDTIDMGYARGIAQSDKALELLDVIGKTRVDTKPLIKGFSHYLCENPDWNEAVQKHFCYYLSSVILKNQGAMQLSVGRYFGLDSRGLLPESLNSQFLFVEYTLDKVPRQLNSYLEIINRLDYEKRKSRDIRNKIAIMASAFNDETVDNNYKERYVYCKLDRPEYVSAFSASPIELEWDRLSKSRDKKSAWGIRTFLNFEYMIRKYYPELSPMDLDKGLEIFFSKTSAAKVLRKFIKTNFYIYHFPFALYGLEKLESELLRHSSPMEVMGCSIRKIPRAALLKAIYQAFAGSTDLMDTLARGLLQQYGDIAHENTKS